ncbi:MAG: phytochelatin synthase [Rhodocyclales bacterium GT-UBC]|nr:MAG: phytochelatin synthase [Rhodocyclales bacterium GT-UBC]
MPTTIRFLVPLLASLQLSPPAWADESLGIDGLHLVPFASAEGLNRLTRTSSRDDFAPLANQFEAQATIAFCGPTSAAIVLNALRPQGNEAPRDRSRLRSEDARYLPPSLELTVPRYTQESVIATGRKTRAQVFGEPATINGKTVSDGGYQLRQLDQVLQAHALSTHLVIADERVTDNDIRRDLIDNLNRPGDYVIVNYRRAAVGQSGGGHISPLAAYDATSDSVLVLDVNPSHYPWVWMPLSTLIRGMRTTDVSENRGYILVQDQPRSLLR